LETQTAGPDAPPDPTAIAPAVVAVVVARDPGAWFEETLAALVEQDYPNLSILVIDAASAEDVKPRVARTAPSAFVRRLEDNPGYGAAANDVLDVVEGAAFYLMCHDDVAPAPDAARLLVEEAYRSNAAIVGPKLVHWDDPRRLLQVGEGIDHAGYPVPLVERHELDQEQHDAVRDVFVVPGAFTLVRADLFTEIGGYDEGIDYLLDDLSLCWRAHIAGARVIVAPDARVRHLEALAARRPVDDRRRLQSRHRLRILLSSCSPLGLAVAVPKLALLNLAEILYTLLVGRTGHARDVAGSWLWNLQRLDELRGARQQVRGFRRVPDAEVRRFMARGSARLTQFLRGQIGSGEDRLGSLARTGREAAGAMRSVPFRMAAGVWFAVGVVLLAGSRHLLTRGIPFVGELVPFRTDPLDLVREWASGWRTAGLGSESPNPTILGAGGALGFLFAGAMGLLRAVVTVGLLPLGAIGAYRLARPVGSRYAQLAALLVYLAVPLPYNALADGRWGVLALYAAAPTMLALLARASGLAPFGTAAGTPGPGLRARTKRQLVLALGLLTALVAMVLPAVVLLVPGIAVALALGSVLAYRTRGSVAMVGVGAGAAVVAVLLHLPWSLDYLLPGTTWSAVVGPEVPDRGVELQELLRFQVGSLGDAPLGWAFVVAAALPLLIGAGERHAWAVRGWTLAVASWGLAWASSRGDLPFALPAADVLLVPAAAGLALAAAMGVAAFEVDLPGYRFGWRQIASGVAAAAVAVGTLPVLAAAVDGRWSMPAGDHSRALGFIDDEHEEQDFRVLWLGDPAALPLGSWELGDGLAYATTDDGTPRLEDLLVGSDDGRTGLLAEAVDLARTGQTARLGRLLAPMGVRYVVVAERRAPAPFAADALPTPRGFRATLDAQLDLEPLDVPAGLSVYRNQAAFPMRAALTGGQEPPTTGGIGATASVDLSDAQAVLRDRGGHLRWRGAVPDDAYVLASVAHSERWQLEVDGRAAELEKPFGWSVGFPVGSGGDATLRFRTPPLRYGLLALQAVAWLLALRALLRVRLATAGRPLDPGPEARGGHVLDDDVSEGDDVVGTGDRGDRREERTEVVW
jgi:GT2 family glycosyltransferase